MRGDVGLSPIRLCVVLSKADPASEAAFLGTFAEATALYRVFSECVVLDAGLEGDRDLVGAALVHGIKNKAEAAYARSDLFVKRRSLVAAWAEFAIKRDFGENVVALTWRKVLSKFSYCHCRLSDFFCPSNEGRRRPGYGTDPTFAHAAIFRLERGERTLAQAMLGAHLGCGRPGFLFLHHPDDLRLGETALSYLFAPSKG